MTLFTSLWILLQCCMCCHGIAALLPWYCCSIACVAMVLLHVLPWYCCNVACVASNHLGSHCRLSSAGNIAQQEHRAADQMPADHMIEALGHVTKTMKNWYSSVFTFSMTGVLPSCNQHCSD